MKEDAQLICPIGYDDKSNVWPTIQKFVCDRLPLKDVVWKSPISSSFVNIEKLPIRFLPSSAKLFNETQHPYRRFLAPYVHVYLLCVESMDAYKVNKPFIKKWLEPYNNAKIGKQPWLIVYVPLGTATMDVYQKIYTRLSADFYTEKAGDHSVMLILPPDTGSKRTLSVAERYSQQSLYQQSYAAIADLMGKLRDGVVASFQVRSVQYDADIRKLDSMRGSPNFDFWQLFLVKESLALMYQMLQLPDRALSLYEELEVLLVFAPAHSLPASDWPVVINTSGGSSGASVATGGKGDGSPTKSSTRSVGEESGKADSEPIPIPGAGPPLPQPSKPKKDLMSDACRCGDDIIAYSINTARMNILWNRFSLFQLQHYIFARQMYFLLVHLRQPTRCAEKALSYMKSSYVSLEQRLARQYPAKPSTSPTELDLYDNNIGNGSEAKMLQLRRAQADVWALMASLKLIRECRALLQLLVGGDAKFNSIFGAGNASYSVNTNSVNSAGDSFSDNLAAISSASTHGSSVVYNSLAELSRSQHGISSHRKSSLDSSTHPAAHSAHSVHGAHSTHTAATLTSTHTTPAMALRDVLFAPELDISTELRESSRVLGDLIEFALKRLQALSSSTVKNAGKRALELALTTVPFDYEKLSCAGGASSSGGVRRTVTKVGSGGIIANTGINPSTAGGTTTAINNTTATTTTNTDYTAVSPRNVELVVTIEQELALLDESRESQGVADVGDRMDQILQSIAQKVRSTSHFWSKLYELSTPSHLLYGSAGGGSAAESSGGGTSNQMNTMAVGSYNPSSTNSNMPSTANSGTATPNTTTNNTYHNNTYHTHEYSPGTSPAKYRTEGSASTPYDYSPDTSDTSPFGSRAGTPVGSPAPASKILGMYSTSGAGGIGGIAASNNTNDNTSTETIHPSSAPSGTTLRKMISRHSSRSLVMSRSQLERGRLLELCLSVLGCSAQWHLQLLANRPRFALSAMLRCADLLMCNQQLAVAAKRLEEALQCGLLAPVSAYICGTGGSSGAGGGRGVVVHGDTTGGSENTSSTGHSANNVTTTTNKSIFQQCMAEEQLHQQQYQHHLHTTLCLALHEKPHYPLYGAWTPLWHYTLRKLLYCLQQGGAWAQYRVVLANLLIPTSADGVNRLAMQPLSLLEDLFREFIALSTIPALSGDMSGGTDGSGVDVSGGVDSTLGHTDATGNTGDPTTAPQLAPLMRTESNLSIGSTSSADGATSPTTPTTPTTTVAAITTNTNTSGAGIGVANNKHGVPAPLPVLRLPFTNYFDIEIGMVEPYTTNTTNNYTTTNTYTETATTDDTTTATTDDTTTTTPTLVSGFEVIRDEWLQTSAVQIEGGSTGGYTIPIKVNVLLPGPVPVDDCYIVYRHFTADTIIHEMLNTEDGGGNSDGIGGEKSEEFVCTPTITTNATYATNATSAANTTSTTTKLILPPGTTTLHMHFTPPVLGDYRLDRIVITVGTAVFTHTFLPSISAATLHSYSYVTTDTLDDEADMHYGEGGGGGRVYSAGESAALAVLKEYFLQHAVIQVLPPADLLRLRGTVAPVVPLAQQDDAYFTLHTAPGEVVRDLVFRAWGREFDPAKSHSLNRFSDESRSVSIGLLSKNSDYSPITAHKTPTKTTNSNNTAFTPPPQFTPHPPIHSAHAPHTPHTPHTSQAITGFVPQKDATPAARRGRRAPLIDTDEYELIQQANAAVASLLAQQGRVRDIYRSGDTGDGSCVVVSVGNGSDWSVIETDSSTTGSSDNGSNGSSNQDDTHLFTSTTDTDVATFTANTMEQSRTLHVRVPFVTTIDTAATTSPVDVVLVLEVTGVLHRGGCTIPILLTTELTLHMCELVDMKVVAYPLYAGVNSSIHDGSGEVGSECKDANSGGGGVFSFLLQCYLSNSTEVDLELTSYGLSTQDPPSDYALLDGPTSLTRLPTTGDSSEDSSNVVVLQPGEAYPAGLMLRVGGNGSGLVGGGGAKAPLDAVVFQYQRNPLQLLSQVYREVYKHRVFTVQRPLCESGGSTSGVGSSVGGKGGIVVPPYTSNGVTLTLCTTPTLHPAATTLSPVHQGMFSVKLGKVFTCQYTLAVRCPATSSPTACSDGSIVTYTNHTSATATSTYNTTTKCITRITPITTLSATLCETAGWMAAGSRRRVLSAHSVHRNNTVLGVGAAFSADVNATAAPPQAESATVEDVVIEVGEEGSGASAESKTPEPITSGANTTATIAASSSEESDTTTAPTPATATVGGYVEVVYELQWDMLPVLLGAAPLPPLMVEYTLAGGQCPVSELVYADKLSAQDRVLVVPASSRVDAVCASRDFKSGLVQVKL